ncbi:NADPH:quinone reductase-like Zn-dependent oxidoreductase [Sinorhizobium fredii]
MRALQLLDDRKLEITDLPEPEAPGPGEVTLRVKAVALNHIDVWGWRGMAFAKRKMPLVIGAEASGVVESIGPGVASVLPGQLVSIYGARTCGLCRPCKEGRDNLCEHVGGVHGFHLDGFAQEKINLPARLLVPAPPGVDAVGAALAPVTFGTVEHMLFDNAKLEPGETILVHAGGSGIGSAAIQLAKKIGCTVITTRSAPMTRSTRQRRSAPIMSSITAPTASRAWCASSPRRRASTSSSNMSARTPGRARCCR